MKAKCTCRTSPAYAKSRRAVLMTFISDNRLAVRMLNGERDELEEKIFITFLVGRTIDLPKKAAERLVMRERLREMRREVKKLIAERGEMVKERAGLLKHVGSK